MQNNILANFSKFRLQTAHRSLAYFKPSTPSPLFAVFARNLEKLSQKLILQKVLRSRLPAALQKKLPLQVALVAVGEAKSRSLNRRYRRKNRAANVLSFRYGSEYGEILYCPAVIRREAKAQGNSYHYQLTWMVVHGMLHLAGVHHEESASAARKSANLERRLLSQFIHYL